MSYADGLQRVTKGLLSHRVALLRPLLTADDLNLDDGNAFASASPALSERCALFRGAYRRETNNASLPLEVRLSRVLIDNYVRKRERESGYISGIFRSCGADCGYNLDEFTSL